jgi:hypothetical protein
VVEVSITLPFFMKPAPFSFSSGKKEVIFDLLGMIAKC